MDQPTEVPPDPVEHLPLVTVAVEMFLRRFPRMAHEREDLLGEGRLALVKASQKYDCSRARFSTYAVRAILNELSEYARRVGSDIGVMLPDTTFKQVNKLRAWRTQNGCLPTRLQCQKLLQTRVSERRHRELLQALCLSNIEHYIEGRPSSHDPEPIPEHSHQDLLMDIHVLSAEDMDHAIYEWNSKFPYCMLCGWKAGLSERSWHPPYVSTVFLYPGPIDLRNLARICAGCQYVARGGHALHHGHPLPSINDRHLRWVKRQEDGQNYQSDYLEDLHISTRNATTNRWTLKPAEPYLEMFIQHQGRPHGA